MEPTATPAAPAQPTDAQTPPAPSAAHAAAAAGDFSKFREASRAERRGDPLPAPAPATADPKAPAAAAAPAQPTDGAKPPSKRQLTLNDQIRTAVDRATADLRAENESLRRGSAPPAPRSAAEPTAQPSAPAQPVVDAKDPEPDAADLKTYPGGEYDPKYVRDQARWAARDEQRKGERAAQERASQDAYKQRTQTIETTFADRMTQAREADPKFLEKLSPDVANLRPMWALGPNERATAANALATLVMQSEVSSDLMLHLSEHPDEFQTLAQARDGYALERAFGRLEARLEKAAAPPPNPLKHVSSAPPPSPSLGTRPADPTNAVAGAVQRRNFGDFRRAQRAKREGRT